MTTSRNRAPRRAARARSSGRSAQLPGREVVMRSVSAPRRKRKLDENFVRGIPSSSRASRRKASDSTFRWSGSARRARTPTTTIRVAYRREEVEQHVRANLPIRGHQQHEGAAHLPETAANRAGEAKIRRMVERANRYAGLPFREAASELSGAIRAPVLDHEDVDASATRSLCSALRRPGEWRS